MSSKLLINRRSILLCLCAPTGGGKSTLADKLLNEFSDSMSLSVSVTSRKPREKEQDGKQYHFISPEEFQKKIDAGDFFEWEEVHGCYYGTPLATIDNAFSNNLDLVLDVDIRGSQTFAESYPADVVVVFIVPPSFNELKNRIQKRSTLPEGELKRRIGTAEREFEALQESYDTSNLKVDYLIVNDDLDKTYEILKGIVVSERKKLSRVDHDSFHDFVDNFFVE